MLYEMGFLKIFWGYVRKLDISSLTIPSLINWSMCIRCGSMMIFHLRSSYKHYLSCANIKTTLMLFSLNSPVIFSLSFIRIFINVSRQLPDCSQCRCSSSVHWAGQQQSRYPCPAFFTLVAHRKINLIDSTNWGWKEIWLVVLKSDTVRRPKLCLLFSDTFANDCLYYDAAYCLWRSVWYSGWHWCSSCGWHLRYEAGGFKCILNLRVFQY